MEPSITELFMVTVATVLPAVLFLYLIYWTVKKAVKDALKDNEKQ
ncbi:MAG: hypothetical protein WEA58_12740 [Balneolaceae bacterium]